MFNIIKQNYSFHSFFQLDAKLTYEQLSSIIKVGGMLKNASNENMNENTLL